MKKLLLVLFLVQALSYGQKKSANKKNIDTVSSPTKTIVYNFKTKTYENSNVRPRVGDPVILKIKNINRLAYEVVIKSEDVAIADEYFKDGIESALKKSFTAGGNNNINNNDELSTTKKISEATISPESLKNPKEEEVKNLSQQIDTINKHIFRNNTSISRKKDSIKILSDEIQNLTILLENEKKNDSVFKKVSQTKITNHSITIVKLQTQIDSLQSLNLIEENSKIKINTTVKAVHETFSQFNKLYSDVIYGAYSMRTINESYQNFYTFVLNPLLECSIYKTFLNDPKYILYQLNSYRNQIYDFEKSVANFNNFYNEAMNNWKIFDAIASIDSKENIRTKYQLYKEEVDKLKLYVENLNLTSKLRKVEAIHAILKEEKAYEMVSSPIQPVEDYITFDVNIKHRDKNKSSEYDDNREFTYMEYTRGGVRFDFSTGIVMNFIGNNDKYGLVNVDGKPDEKKIVVTENNQFTPTLAGMFHTSFRSSGIWAFGLTLGASINVETFELGSVFPGVSLLIGKQQKFIISAGPAFRQIEELKANYREDDFYKSSDFNDDTQITAKQFRMGFFCGITYNLTQKQRAKFKIPD